MKNVLKTKSENAVYDRGFLKGFVLDSLPHTLSFYKVAFLMHTLKPLWAITKRQGSERLISQTNLPMGSDFSPVRVSANVVLRLIP